VDVDLDRGAAARRRPVRKRDRDGNRAPAADTAAIRLARELATLGRDPTGHSLVIEQQDLATTALAGREERQAEQGLEGGIRLERSPRLAKRPGEGLPDDAATSTGRPRPADDPKGRATALASEARVIPACAPLEIERRGRSLDPKPSDELAVHCPKLVFPEDGGRPSPQPV